jgi:hypothetical protein
MIRARDKQSLSFDQQVGFPADFWWVFMLGDENSIAVMPRLDAS